MKQIVRYSVSGVIGLIITAALFIGMLGLLKGDKPAMTNTDSNINFSFVKDFSAPEVKPPNTIEKPVPPEVKQPPSAPVLNMEVNSDPIIKTPIAGTKSSQLNIRDEFYTPSSGGTGPFYTGSPGTLKNAITPIYPQRLLINKTEGWVKVQISVNELGTVSAVSIVDAEPARVFNAAAKKSVKKWKFHPKTIDGKAVPFVAIQTIEFRIDQ